MKNSSYIPDRGDIVTLNFNPQSGYEQKGLRPALVISIKLFNKCTNGAIVCPITNTKKENHPLRVSLNDNLKTTGYIMCEQIKTVDFVARKASFKESVDVPTMNEVLDIIGSFIE